MPLLNGLARLYENVVGTVAPDVDRVSRLALVVFMIAGVMVCLVRFNWSRGNPGYRREQAGSSTHISGGALS